MSNPVHSLPADVPVLARKPGASRSGAPFQGSVLPSAMERIPRKFKAAHDGGRQMVSILATMLTDGIDEPPKPFVKPGRLPSYSDPSLGIRIASI